VGIHHLQAGRIVGRPNKRQLGSFGENLTKKEALLYIWQRYIWRCPMLDREVKRGSREMLILARPGAKGGEG
jgi:hypothetical protein